MPQNFAIVVGLLVVSFGGALKVPSAPEASTQDAQQAAFAAAIAAAIKERDDNMAATNKSETAMLATMTVEEKLLCEGLRPLDRCVSGLRGTTQEHAYGLVWLHGLGNGDSSHYYEYVLVPKILEATGQPKGKGLSAHPQAPVIYVESDDLEEQSWHRQKKDHVKVDVTYDPPSHGCPLEDGLNNSPIVHKKIDQLIALGIPPHKIIVAGHSMGGSMVYTASVTYDKPLGGAINLSGGMLGWWMADKLTHKAQKNLPMLWIKGTEDDIVPQAHQDEIMPVLKKAGFEVETGIFHGGHTLTPEVIPQVVEFINRHV